jgi:collagen type III alpha
MATAITPPPAPSKLDARLEEELGKATGRIRLNDVLTGALALAVLTLAYATAAVLLDRWLVLPEWVRQCMLAGFLVAFAGVAYLTLIRPLRRRVNPRFAARKVEETVPGAKNAIINWVDLRDKELPASVRGAVAVKAVEGVAGADVNKAVESKRVIWLGAAAGLLLAVLAALFVILKPAPFLSLVNRTFNPFTPIPIASRTALTIEEPAGGDVTVTAGDPVTVRVHVGGSIPEPNGPDRVRLRVRYNPAAPEFDELPLEPGGSAREWVLRVPQGVVQNGFWYRVAGGDAETTEHRVAVRSRPLFREYEVRYVYPAYTRLKPEVAREPALWAYPGTEVTITARTNRQVKRGWLQIDGRSDLIPGQLVGEARDSLQFKLTMPRKSGTYRLGFTSADDEPSEPTPAYPIKVAADLAPLATITAPAEEEITLPPSGLLKVDGTLSDDFGLTSATLQMRVSEGEIKADISPKPYREGKSFRRESDGTYPTAMDYKDSVSLDSLTYKTGGKVSLAEGMVLEYWLEATDNCTEPRPNVGRSEVKRVRIGPQEKEPEQQKQDRQQRATEEQKHQKQQDEQLQAEKRDPPQQLRPDNQQQDSEPKEGEQGQEGSTQEPKGDAQSRPEGGDPKQKQQPGQTGGEQQPEQKPGQPGGDPKQEQQPGQRGEGATGDPTQQSPDHRPGDTTPKDRSQQDQSGKPPTGDPSGDPTKQPSEGKTSPEGGTSQNQEPKSGQQPGDPDHERRAREVQEAIDQQNRQPGSGRSQDPADARPAESPADPKPAGDQPMTGGAEQKAGQPQGTPSADSKPAGDVEQPKPAETKPEPKPASDPQQQPHQQASPGSGATGDTQKHPPVAGNVPAEERPQPQPGSEGTDPKKPEPGEPKQDDPGAARGGAATGQTDPKATPPAAETKPKPEASRGQERPMEGTSTGEQTPQERPADARGPKPVEPGATKQPPPGTELGKPTAAGEKPQPSAEGSDPKTAPADARPEKTRPEPAGTSDPKGPTAAGQERPEPRATEKPAGTDPEAAQGDAGQKKIDPEELRQAAQDLASGDPQKQQAARDKLDNMIGKENRERAEREARQLQDDLQSSDPERRQAAEQKLKELAKQAEQQGDQASKPKIDPKELQQAAQDLASGDPQKQQSARDKLDSMIGKENRERAEREARQLQDDLQSSDPERRQAAEQKLKELAKQAEQQAQKGGERGQMSQEEMQKWAEKALDLASDDEARRKDAEQEFDKAIGQERREQLQQAAKDAASGDPQRQETARKQMERMAKDASEAAKGRQQPTQEQIDKLRERAKDLNSPDEATRKAAEREFDDLLGKQNRELLQEMMKDPARAEDLRQQMEQLPKDLRPRGGAGGDRKGSLHEDDPRNRLRSAELQLQQFEKNRNNKELQDRLGWTQEEYDRFLSEQQKRVAQMREEVAKRDQAETAPPPTGPATLRVGEGSGGEKLQTRPDGTAGTTGGASPGTAPSGYSEAQRRFAEEARKLRKGQDKK